MIHLYKLTFLLFYCNIIIYACVYFNLVPFYLSVSEIQAVVIPTVWT